MQQYANNAIDEAEAASCWCFMVLLLLADRNKCGWEYDAAMSRASEQGTC